MPNNPWGNFPEYADDEGGEDHDGGSMVIDRQKEEQKQKLEPPKPWQVIMFNDDYSEFEFVEHVLQYHFEKSIEEARRLSFQIHVEGKCVCKVYQSRELAEAKSAVVNDYAQANDFPLKTKPERVP